MLTTIQDLTDDERELGRPGDQALDASARVAHARESSTAHRLLSGDAEAAFQDGCAPALATALEGRVTSVLSADRVAHYLNLLYALLLLRRGHELEPRHDDLYARVLAPQRMLGTEYSSDEYAHDLEMLEQWGAVARSTEAKRLRGYKDNRRVQYRYRITGDALALLEWLEDRLGARLTGGVRDSRDRLADIVGHLKEARRVLDAWRKGERHPDEARRAYYLFESVCDTITATAGELLGFRAEMVAFAQRPYDLNALREILSWLQHYVDNYMRRIHELRAEIRDRLEQLGAPRYRAALAECRAAMEAQREAIPRALRQTGRLREPDELLALAHMFFCHRGRLADLCRHIDDSARAVLTKMHRHIKELERRNARLDDIRSAIAFAAALPADHPANATWMNQLVASAHARFDRRPGFTTDRCLPPTPRKHASATPQRSSYRPLAEKRATRADARTLRAKRQAELRVWLRERVLRGAASITLDAAMLEGAASLRNWMDVERTRRLGGGRKAGTLGARIGEAGGRALVGDQAMGLDAPNVVIELEDES